MTSIQKVDAKSVRWSCLSDVLPAGASVQVGVWSEANGRVVPRKGFAETYSTNIVEGVGHS